MDDAGPAPNGRASNATAPGDEQAGERRIRPWPLLVLVLMGVVIAAAVIAVAQPFSGSSATPELPTDWEETRKDAEALEIGGGRFSATVVVGAAEETCWGGYVIEAVIEGCGSKAFAVTRAPRLLGANVKKVVGGRSALAIALWDGGSRLAVHGTKAPYGVAAVSGTLPRRRS